MDRVLLGLPFSLVGSYAPVRWGSPLAAQRCLEIHQAAEEDQVVAVGQDVLDVTAEGRLKPGRRLKPRVPWLPWLPWLPRLEWRTDLDRTSSKGRLRNIRSFSDPTQHPSVR